MITKLPIDKNGYLVGVRMIGCEGFVRAKSTPAAKSPLLLTEDGRIARVIRHTDTKAVCGLSQPLQISDIQGDYRLFARRDDGLRVRPDESLFFAAFRAAEVPWVEKAIDTMLASKDVSEFLCAAQRPLERVFHLSWHLTDEYDGGGDALLAWQCTTEQMREAFDVIRVAALSRLIDAATRHEHQAIEEASWLLQRSSKMDLAQVELAAAGLASIGDREAKRLLAAYMPRASDNGVQDTLERAAERLEQMVQIARVIAAKKEGET